MAMKQTNKKGRAAGAVMAAGAAMAIRMTPLSELKPYPNNPRDNRAAIEKIADSIRDFGFKQPVVIDVNNVIVAGHTRVEAAKRLGMKEVPCIVADDLTPEQVRAYRLVDNKTAEFSTWDEELLNIELADIQIPDFDMADYGFDMAEIDRLFEGQGMAGDVAPAPVTEAKGESNGGVNRGIGDSAPVSVAAPIAASVPPQAPSPAPEPAPGAQNGAQAGSAPAPETGNGGGYCGDERERTYNLYRLYEYDASRVEGFYDMPVLKACHFVPDALVGFNYVKSIVDNDRESEYSKGVHFFLDDYQFERIWREPHVHIERIKRFACALTPDFSTYADMPVAMMIWNMYRSKLIGQMMQDAGINVIPVVRWSTPDRLDFFLDGIEPGGVIAMSTVGLAHDKECQELSRDGLNEALKRLRPELVLHYGCSIGLDFKDTPVRYFQTTAFGGSGRSDC